MNDRRILRSRARGRRLEICSSCEEDGTDTSTASDQNNDSSPPGTGRQSQSQSQSRGRCRGGYCSDSGTYNHRRQRLPPIGVFWDIENCQVPRGKSATAVAQVIREEFFSGYEENEFMVACDANRESPQVVKELNDAQVCVMHVPSLSKNAADEKLRHGMRKFAHTHGSCAAVVLISGDVNFAPDLCDLRHRLKIRVILVHNDNCSESLMINAHETFKFSQLVANIPLRSTVNTNQQSEVTVSGLPLHLEAGKVRARLKRLAENCGGRVGLVLGTRATVQFSSIEFGIRAQKRMDGEDVFGSQISVSYPTIVSNPQRFSELSPVKNFRKAVTNGYKMDDRRVPFVTEDPRSFYKPIPPFNNSTNNASNGVFKKPFPIRSLFNQENVPTLVNSKFKQTTLECTHSKQAGLFIGPPNLGRQNSESNTYESRTNEGYSNGRHSLDSMLDFDVDREEREQSNANFESWLRNSTSNLGQKCPAAVLGVNTSIPPPPIVNLPRRNDKYFFHPIDTLTNGHPQSSPSPASSNDASELLRCPLHSLAHSENSSMACVTVRLSDFSARLMALVTSHENRIPLASLRDCYEAQFNVMVTDARSVPLEHLVTSVCSVELVKSSSGKYLRLATNISPTFSDTPKIEGPLLQLSKDIQTLLKSQPRCQLPFDHVIAAYHRAFGKTCRLSDYGCTKLIQLLDKLPTVVQVMGERADRVVTLTHRAQMQRFTSDLTRVLQSTPHRQLTVKQLPQYWLTALGCTLEPVEYGLSYVEDLLSLVPASSVVVNGETISLPRSLQTAEQARRTDKFVAQVIELLGTVANFTIEFNNFCQEYHKHFKVQCKLADYGFSKLLELFEAIPHVVTVKGDVETGRWVSLTHPERLKVLSGRVLSLVQSKQPPGLSVDSLRGDYLFQYGHALKPDNYNCTSPLELISKLDSVKVLTSAEGKPIIVPAVKEQGPAGEDKKSSCQPKVNKDVESQANNVKTNGAVKSSSTVLLDLLKKGQQCPAVKNGVNSTELYKLKPVATEQVQVTLLKPEEFLRPANKSPTTISASVFPSSPDPSMLPKPVGLTINKATNVFDLGVKLLEDVDLADQNRCIQSAMLAPQFCSPLQL